MYECKQTHSHIPGIYALIHWVDIYTQNNFFKIFKSLLKHQNFEIREPKLQSNLECRTVMQFHNIYCKFFNNLHNLYFEGWNSLLSRIVGNTNTKAMMKR